MIRRSSLIFAASLAVLSTLEPTFGFAAAAPAQHHNEVEKPRFLRREVKRLFSNTTTSAPGVIHLPFGSESTSDLNALAESLTTSSIDTSKTTPDTTITPTHTQTPEQTTHTSLPESSTPISSTPITSQGNDQTTHTTIPPATSNTLTSHESVLATSQSTSADTAQTPATSQHTIPATSQSSVPNAVSIPTTSKGVSSPPVDSNTASPASSPSVNTNTDRLQNSPTTNVSPATSPSVSSNAGEATSKATTAAGNTETSAVAGPSTAESKNTAANGQSTSNVEQSHSETTVPAAIVPSTSEGQQNTPATSTAGETTTGNLPINPVGVGESSKTTPGSQQTSTVAPSTTEQHGGQQTPLTAFGESRVIPSVSTQQILPTITPETSPIAETKPTTGVTEHSLTSNTLEGQTTAAGQPSETHSSTGEQPGLSITPSNIAQTVKSVATEQSQSQTNKEQSSTGGEFPINTNTARQQSSPSQIIPESVTPTGIQKQSSIPAIINTKQQPFTQSGETQATSAPGVANTQIPGETLKSSPIPVSIGNTQVPGETLQNSPSVTGIGNTQLPGPTLKSIPLSAGEQTTINALPGESGVSTAPGATEGSTNTKTANNGILPTISASLGASLGATSGELQTTEAQPASSPSLPASIVVPPTATNTQPLITSGLGFTNLPTTVLQQGTSQPVVTSGLEETNVPTTALQQVTSQLGGVLPVSGSTAPSLQIPGSVLDSTPTGTQLYSALTNALQNTVGPGSTMLPNGQIVPSSAVVNTLESQAGQTNTIQGQQSGIPAILSVPSITLSPSSVVANPLVSSPLVQQTGAASITLPGGSAIPNPLISSSLATIQPEGSGAASITLPGGTVIPNPFEGSTASSGLLAITSNGVIISNPLATAAPVTSNGIVLTNPAGSSATAIPIIPASVTLPGGSVIANPSATLAPSEVILSNGQKSIVNPLVSNSINPSQQSVIGTQASTTDSNGNVLPIPVQSSAVINTAGTATGPLESQPPITTGAVESGSLLTNVPVNTGAVETGPATLSSGAAVPASVASSAPGTNQNGATSPVIVGSATNTNGETLPVTAGQVTGSSSLSGGAVVPLTASNPSASPASLGVSSAGSSESTDHYGAAFLSLASKSGSPSAASIGQGTETAGPSGTQQMTAGQTGTDQTGSGQTATGQSAAGQTGTAKSEGVQATGASGSSVAGNTGASQTASLAAPAPVTGTATALPNTASSPAQVTHATDTQNYPSNGKGPFTQSATGYDTETVQSVPTSILAQPSTTAPSQTSSSGSTGLPTGVPLHIYPPNGAGKRPDNTELIQIGFLYPLNYDFVVGHPASQQQIFKYLPMGIAWGLQIDIENVTMQSLNAYDTTQDLHYITTLALAWVPNGLVDSLGLLVRTPTSRFYHTPDNSTNTLLAMINTGLPINGDNSTDGGDSTAFGAVPTSTNTMKDGGAPVGGGIGSSNPVRASSVGIACGVAAGAAAYGAAMFFVARRYRKRRQSHIRSPSMFSSPVMSHVGPDAGAGAALMSGGVGDHRSPSPYRDEDARGPSRGSGRSASTGRQQISAPVMAENSLGWN